MAHIRRLFRKSALLQIVATNIRDGEDLAMHPAGFIDNVVATVRENLARRFPEGGVKTKDCLIELENLCFGSLPERVGSSYLLKAQAGSTPDGDDWYTTVTKVEHWLRYIDRSTLDALSDEAGVELPFKPMGGGVDPALIEILETVKTGSFIPKVGFSLGYPLVWITPRTAFDYAMASATNKADLARDHLGLVHQKSKIHLIAMHIPASAVRLVASNRPTFADAGQHRRFFLSALAPRPFPRPWGQTLDLAQLEDRDTLAGGAAERVCARIEARHVAGQAIEFDYLGRLRTSRGTTAATDAAFAVKQVQRDPVGFVKITAQI